MNLRLMRLFLFVCIPVVFSGCALRVQQLNALPLNVSKTIDNASQTNKSFLIYPLVDLRGEVFSNFYPTTFIPVVNLFHSGEYIKYPEYAGAFKTMIGPNKPVITVGSLPNAFPYLLSEMVREMRLTTNVTPIDQINTKTNLNDYDYVIMGKLLFTQLKTQTNIIPMAILAIFGAPFSWVECDIQFELSLFKSDDMNNAIATETYTFRKVGMVGNYYGQSINHELLVDGLEDTLQKVVMDLSTKTK